MLETAENLGREYRIPREEQDGFAVRSHQRAAAAEASGIFDAEIVPVTVRGRKGDVVVERDEHIRPDSSVETLSRLRPVLGRQANYATAKAGLQGFTKTVAIELGRFGVTVNCIAPGFIQSDMTRATAERLGQDWESYVAARMKEIPVGRAGVPEDIAAAVSFFVREEAGYVTGQVLYVAGGPRA
jgi:NAD(P)-dependent dehydrogenase (short-subunit alcohol dehydrogenase family)